MKKSHEKRAYLDEEKEDILFDNALFVASATEFTGLAPTPMLTEDQVEAYETLSGIPLSKDRPKEENKTEKKS